MRGRQWGRLGTRAAGAVVVAVTLLHPLARPAGAEGVTRVSTGAGGAEANADSMFPALSADGRVVAFASYASNLVAGDGNGVTDVFVRDLESGAVDRASVGEGGAEADADSFFAALSADGGVVAFVSYAANLVAGDTNAAPDVFVRDRAAGATVRVSVGPAGVEGDAPTYGAPAVSADGQVVAFASFASNLVPGDTNGTADVFLHDRRTGLTELVSGGGDGVSFSPAVSGDGSVVAFVSFASNLVSDDGNGTADVFVRDRLAGTTERVSVAVGGGDADSASFLPAVSGDGDVVAFASFASNLVPGDGNGDSDVFVRERAAGVTTRVSTGAGGVDGDGASFSPAVSADGRHVGFASYAANLAGPDTNGTVDVYLHDRRSGTTERASGTDSLESNGLSDRPAISGDGLVLAFDSYASNLVPGDGNEAADVFVVGTSDTVPPVLSVPADVTVPATGPAGAAVAFAASAVDEIDPAPVVACDPPSGTVFPVGTTVVACTATDVSGNLSAGAFTVHVEGAAEQVDGVATEIVELGLPGGTTTVLTTKLGQAAGAIDAGKVEAACRSLSELQAQLRAQSGKRLTVAEAAALSAEVARIQAVLACS